MLGLTFGRKGRFDEAIAEFKQALAIAGARPLWSGFLGQVYALAGKTEEAIEILNELFAAARKPVRAPVAFAIVYAGLGKIDEAFHWLGKAVDERDGLLIYLKVGSVFDSLRSDRRFSEILARVGLQGDPGLDVLHPPAESRLLFGFNSNRPAPRHLCQNWLLGIAAARLAYVAYLAISIGKKLDIAAKANPGYPAVQDSGWRSRCAPSC